MAVIKGYFDDSRTNEHVWTVAGYVGKEAGWQRFETMWPKVLAKHGVPYFHMKDMCKLNGVYSKWHPVKEHEAERADFLQDLARVVGFCVLDGFYSTVREQDLKAFNAKYKTGLDPLALAIYTVILQIWRTYPHEIVQVVFDRADKIQSKIEKAEQYTASDRRNTGVTDKIKPIPLAQGFNFKNIVQLQAADFLAYELRKHHLDLNEWFEIADLPTDQNERGKHLMAFSSLRKNREI